MPSGLVYPYKLDESTHVFRSLFTSIQVELLHLPRIGIGVGGVCVSVFKSVSFYFKDLYVMDKAL